MRERVFCTGTGNFGIAVVMGRRAARGRVCGRGHAGRGTQHALSGTELRLIPIGSDAGQWHGKERVRQEIQGALLGFLPTSSSDGISFKKDGDVDAKVLSVSTDGCVTISVDGDEESASLEEEIGRAHV